MGGALVAVDGDLEAWDGEGPGAALGAYTVLADVAKAHIKVVG